MENTGRKKVIRVFALAMAVFAVALAGLFFALRAHKEKQKLEESFAASQTELSILNLASSVRNERLQNALTAEESEQIQRDRLTAGLIAKDREDLLLLVNPWNALPDDYEPRLVNIGKTDAGGNEMMFDERGATALKELIYACIDAYWAPVPISTYRTQEYQQELFDAKKERLIAEMQTPYEEIDAVAAQSVARPGTSEHQTGFAADIVDEYYPSLDNSQEWSNTQQWLMQHCTDYGFILRYPNGTTDITGIIYEPWHYRYVGKSIAKDITEKGITFEEYIEQIN